MINLRPDSNYDIWKKEGRPSERQIEIPFMLDVLSKYFNNLKKKVILDVGKDEGNIYTEELKRRGFIVESCDFQDKWKNKIEYFGKFQDVNFYKNFDIILFISTMEHIGCYCETDYWKTGELETIILKKALGLLNHGGSIINTVPFGKGYLQKGEFIHYNSEMINKYYYNLSGIAVWIERQWARLINGKWELKSEEELRDCIYKGNGAIASEGLYMEVLRQR